MTPVNSQVRDTDTTNPRILVLPHRRRAWIIPFAVGLLCGLLVRGCPGSINVHRTAQ